MPLQTSGIVVLFSLLASSSSQRFALSLDGIWRFKISPDNQPDIGFSEEWWNTDFSQDLDAMDMPVPSSYNDITTDSAIRDFVGWAWYQRHLDLPDFMIHWKGIVAFHFGSAQYYTQVWVNNMQIGTHEGGHIPFEFAMPEGFGCLNSDKIRITVAINNTLNSHTIPQGSLTFRRDEDDFKYKTYTHAFDYFDYSGLNGNVRLIFKPPAYIDNVIIRNITISSFNSDHDEATYKVANVWWSSQLFQPSLLKDPRVRYVVKDPFGKLVVSNEHPLESLTVTILTVIEDPQFWWPRSTYEENVQPGMMYELKVTLIDGTVEVDSLSKTFGIRTIETNEKNLVMNGKLLYLKGFGMHQDAEIRGRGFDQVQLVRDINLLKWTGANAIRTSHYPYSEEFLEMADRHGIMVILETPACSLSGFHETLLKRHKEVLTEMWEAFRNHPSVIMWSLANEPESNDGNSTQYFKELVDHIKSLDPSRPVTFVTSQQIKNEKAIQSVDVICVNRYQGWYSLGGRLDLIQHHVAQEIQEWSDSYGKPVILTEYGAEALSGYHSLPSTMWTENYQIELFHEHFKAFDFLLQKRSLSGEMVWNFADFKVPQEYFRAEYCNKGIFTRNRQPKSAAYTIKKRYEALLLEESVIPSVVLC
uniref:Beta-glucuronidase n=1 Tax=Lygus hesperus TaxID=30085 RepID=A0A0A9WBL9_LYGHE